MGKLVTPKVFLIGHTTMIDEGMLDYLEESGNTDFVKSISDGRLLGLSDGEILTSFYAKLCYASLTLGKNNNITRIRDIEGNLKGTFDQAHLSVWEHCCLNFVVTDCSRVYTHEQVRHRVGTAYSQTSGRYVRGDNINIIFDPILESVREEVVELQAIIEERYKKMVEKMDLDNMTDFNRKKKITSALRRMLPNGQSNEMGFSINLRSIRHLVMMRTARHAEWEIRAIFEQVYKLTKDKYPLLYYSAKEEVVDGLLEISGMRMQPYDKTDTK